MPLTDMSHDRKRQLRREVLEFFQKPRRSRNMHKEPEFVNSEFSNQEIREMMYALETAGLIYKPRGYGPGSVYTLTTDGYALMEIMDQVIKLEAEDDRE